MNNEITYEKAIERLEEIVKLLDKSDVPLDEALALYEEGTALCTVCNKKLSEAKQKIIEIKKD